MKKRLIAVIITLLLVMFVMPVSAMAATYNMQTEYNDKELSIIELLFQATYADKENLDKYGLSEGDFTNLKVGNTIPSYLFESNQIKINDEIKYIPILKNNAIVALVMAVGKEGPTYVLSTEYVDSLNDNILNGKKVAIVSTEDEVYISDGKNYELVKDGNGKSNVNIELENKLVNAVEVEPQKELEVSLASVPNSKTLNVPIKGQGSYPICWAACVASVGQYRQGTNYTAQTVAQRIRGSLTAGTVSNIQNGLSSLYIWSNTGMATSYQTKSYINDGVITRHISNDQPIIAWCKVTTGTSDYDHTVVVRGYLISSQGLILYIMNSGSSGGAGLYETAYPTSGTYNFQYANKSWRWDTGFLLVNWQKWSSGWWYFNADGTYKIGWFKPGATWYYFASNGRMYENEWLKHTDGYWYWLKAGGAMACSESVYINGKTYNFDASGRCTNP